MANICHDVALDLSYGYLHSNAISHRHLSSNNVLLIGERLAIQIHSLHSHIEGSTSHVTIDVTYSPCVGIESYMLAFRDVLCIHADGYQGNNHSKMKRITCIANLVFTLLFLQCMIQQTTQSGGSALVRRGSRPHCLHRSGKTAKTDVHFRMYSCCCELV